MFFTLEIFIEYKFNIYVRGTGVLVQDRYNANLYRKEKQKRKEICTGALRKMTLWTSRIDIERVIFRISIRVLFNIHV